MDAMLGQFEFDRDLGWKRRVILGGSDVEVVLGSNGDVPSDEMLQTARSWVAAWPLEHPKILKYIHAEIQKWPNELNPPVPEKLEVESINILWRDKPTACMIYFKYPGDSIRLWHLTLYGFEPHGFAFDD